MRIPHFCMAGILTMMLVAGAPASIISGPKIDPANGNTYYLLSTDTWTNSEAQAVAMGGHLATIANAAENTWVFNTFGGVSSSTTQNLWIGLYDPTVGDGSGALHASDFKWSSGAPVTYTTWGAGEPNNTQSFGGEYYAQLDIINYPNLPPQSWNDANNSADGDTNYGVVEVAAVPEPMSLAFISVCGACTLLARHRRKCTTSLAWVG